MLSSRNENSVLRWEPIFSQRESSFGLFGSETKTMLCSYKKKKLKKGKIKEHSQHALGLNLNLNLFKVNQ